MNWRHGWPFRRPTVDERRWVVLDVEASGLDAARDRLLAIGAVALRMDGRAPRIDLGDSFEVVLRQPGGAVDKANILLHGIGIGAQREGVDAGDALAAFEAWLGSSPVIAFHAAFDATLIRRTQRARLGRTLRNPWLDLEPIAAVVRADVQARSLDEWTAALGVHNTRRHQAAADAFATAELLLRLWPAVCEHHAGGSFAALQRLASQRRWLRR